MNNLPTTTLEPAEVAAILECVYAREYPYAHLHAVYDPTKEPDTPGFHRGYLLRLHTFDAFGRTVERDLRGFPHFPASRNRLAWEAWLEADFVITLCRTVMLGLAERHQLVPVPGPPPAPIERAKALSIGADAARWIAALYKGD